MEWNKNELINKNDINNKRNEIMLIKSRIKKWKGLNLERLI